MDLSLLTKCTPFRLIFIPSLTFLSRRQEQNWITISTNTLCFVMLKIEFFVTDYNPYWFPQTILTADNLCFLLLYFICYILVSVYSKAVKANQLLLSQTLLICVYKWVGVLIIVHSMSTVKTRGKLICSEPMSVIGDQGDCRCFFFFLFFNGLIANIISIWHLSSSSFSYFIFPLP